MTEWWSRMPRSTTSGMRWSSLVGLMQYRHQLPSLRLRRMWNVSDSHLRFEFACYEFRNIGYVSAEMVPPFFVQDDNVYELICCQQFFWINVEELPMKQKYSGCCRQHKTWKFSILETVDRERSIGNNTKHRPWVWLADSQFGYPSWDYWCFDTMQFRIYVQ